MVSLRTASAHFRRYQNNYDWRTPIQKQLRTWYDEYLSRRTVTFQLSFKCHLWGHNNFSRLPCHHPFFSWSWSIYVISNFDNLRNILGQTYSLYDDKSILI